MTATGLLDCNSFLYRQHGFPLAEGGELSRGPDLYPGRQIAAHFQKKSSARACITGKYPGLSQSDVVPGGHPGYTCMGGALYDSRPLPEYYRPPRCPLSITPGYHGLLPGVMQGNVKIRECHRPDRRLIHGNPGNDLVVVQAVAGQVSGSSGRVCTNVWRQRLDCQKQREQQPGFV